MKTLSDAVRPARVSPTRRTLQTEAYARRDDVTVDSSADSIDAALLRHMRLVTTAPIVRDRNRLRASQWEIVRALAQQGPQTVSALLTSGGDGADREAALEALLSEGLVCVCEPADDARARVVGVTARGRTVLDTIRPEL
jgi:DNA-binding MarR family transcriptional regulator